MSMTAAIPQLVSLIASDALFLKLRIEQFNWTFVAGALTLYVRSFQLALALNENFIAKSGHVFVQSY